MDFFGRERELARIEREIKSDGQSAILVYGRRRVGKSELIKQSLSTTNCRSIYYECKETSEQNNLESLSALVSEVFSTTSLLCPSRNPLRLSSMNTRTCAKRSKGSTASCSRCWTAIAIHPTSRSFSADRSSRS